MPTQTWDDIKRNLNERKVNLDNTTNNNAINQIASHINLHIKDYAYNAGISTNPDNNNAKVMANQYFDILILICLCQSKLMTSSNRPYQSKT